jgi:hypothetical protein
MTSTQIIVGTNPGSRPTFWNLGQGKDLLVEGCPGSVAVRNAGQGRCTTVQTDGDDNLTGTVAELTPGQTLNIPVGQRFRISALASCQLQLAWSP